MEATAKDDKRLCACGGEKVCYSSDVGGVEYDDEYVVYCLKCGVVHLRQSVYGGSPCSSDWLTKCPFCGRDNDEHAPIPSYLWGYVTRYLPLLKFNMSETEVWIVLYGSSSEEEAIVMDPFQRFGGRRIKLPLPVPYDRTEIFPTWENYDEVSLSLRVLETGESKARIEAEIKERGGYWYYGSLDDAKPPIETTRKEIVITVDSEKKFFFTVNPLG